MSVSLVLGFFDGVHLGHQSVLDCAVKSGDSVNLITLEDSPSLIFCGQKEYILSNEMRFIDGKLANPTTIKAGFAMKNQIEDYIKGNEVIDTKGQKVLRFYFNNNGILFYEKETSAL